MCWCEGYSQKKMALPKQLNRKVDRRLRIFEESNYILEPLEMIPPAHPGGGQGQGEGKSQGEAGRSTRTGAPYWIGAKGMADNPTPLSPRTPRPRLPSLPPPTKIMKLQAKQRHKPRFQPASSRLTGAEFETCILSTRTNDPGPFSRGVEDVQSLREGHDATVGGEPV